MTKNIVIKFGGSLLFSEGGTINYEKITEFCDIIKNNKNYDSIVIVCGGGTIARQYIKAIRGFTDNEVLCDMIGIDISRINSRLMIANMKEFAYPQVPKSFEELAVALNSHKVAVMGGLQPGQSTTSVAIQVAEFLKAKRLVILTDVDGIYDKDPKVFDDAQLLRELNYDSLQKIILEMSEDTQAAAGEYRIFDAVSLQILKRSNVVVSVISGSKLDQFKKLWNNEKVNIGTTITK
ncbi:MAG TPA: UMP kinase [Candidatus Nanopelagicaceae bacterium]|nr:UMP kinase [Candidatus Nanopelagicaceae bacterium]